jgi:hypothetical protein
MSLFVIIGDMVSIRVGNDFSVWSDGRADVRLQIDFSDFMVIWISNIYIVCQGWYFNM